MDEVLSGMWLIQAWQSDLDDLWYADLEFAAERATEAFEVESDGPAGSKTEATELARKGLEAHWLNPPDPTVF